MLPKDVGAHTKIVRQEDGIALFRHRSFNIPKMDGHFMSGLHSLILTLCSSWEGSMTRVVPNDARQLVRNTFFWGGAFLRYPTQRYKMLQDDATDLHVRIINQLYKIIQTHSFFKNFSYFCKHSVWTSSPTANPAKEQNEAEIKNWKEKAFQWAWHFNHTCNFKDTFSTWLCNEDCLQSCFKWRSTTLHSFQHVS